MRTRQGGGGRGHHRPRQDREPPDPLPPTTLSPPKELGPSESVIPSPYCIRWGKSATPAPRTASPSKWRGRPGPAFRIRYLRLAWVEGQQTRTGFRH